MKEQQGNLDGIFRICLYGHGFVCRFHSLDMWLDSRDMDFQLSSIVGTGGF